jgi:hypothetical protein
VIQMLFFAAFVGIAIGLRRTDSTSG